MSTDTTQQRRFGIQALIPVLALLLLGTACSEKETTAPGSCTCSAGCRTGGNGTRTCCRACCNAGCSRNPG